jgi:hypothetical protein
MVLFTTHKQFHSTSSQGRFDLQRDVTFNSYGTGAGRIEWKFPHKNHLFFGSIPLNQSEHIVLARTVTFQAQTFGTGLTASTRLQSYLLTPGYQYDIIRSKQGHLGIVARLDLFYIKGSLNVAAQTLNGTLHSAHASSATLRASLLALGPYFRYYLIPNSTQLSVAGNVPGMSSLVQTLCFFLRYGWRVTESIFRSAGRLSGKLPARRPFDNRSDRTITDPARCKRGACSFVLTKQNTEQDVLGGTKEKKRYGTKSKGNIQKAKHSCDFWR